MVVSENGYTPQDGQFWRKKLGRNRHNGPVDLELQWDHGQSQWMVKTTWHGLAKLWRGDLDTVTLCHNPAIYIYIYMHLYIYIYIYMHMCVCVLTVVLDPQ